MNGTDLALRNENAAVMEDLITKGDLAKLTPEARARYYVLTCESLGLNPLTKPFEYLTLENRLTLYATRTATDQLRAKHGVSIRIVDRRREDDLYVVTAQATLPDGRSDEATGAVSIAGMRGSVLANALMKCETKAKRRVTLSVCGLGWMDETEVGTVPGAQRVDTEMAQADYETPTFQPAPSVRGPGVATRAALPVNRDLGRPAATRPAPVVHEPTAAGPEDEAPHPADTEAAAQEIETSGAARPDHAVLQRAGATAKQLETIARMARAAGKTIETEGLTRQQASEIITSLVDGMSAGR